jgi:hypothetical protein
MLNYLIYGGKKMIIKLDFHEAIKTSARTYWMVKYGDELITIEDATYRGLLMERLSTKTFGKTHWYSFYELNPNIDTNSIRFLRIRISNRGNINTQEYLVNELKISEEEEKIIEKISKQ